MASADVDTLSEQIINTSLALNDTTLVLNRLGSVRKHRMMEGDVVTRFSLETLLKNAPKLADIVWTGHWMDLLGVPNFAPVALSGQYSDLLNVPTNLSHFLFDLVDVGTLAYLSVQGQWRDVLNKPAKLSEMAEFDLIEAGYLAPIAHSASFYDLTDYPRFLGQFVNNLGLKQICYSGMWADLGGRTAGMAADLQYCNNRVSMKEGISIPTTNAFGSPLTVGSDHTPFLQSENQLELRTGAATALSVSTSVLGFPLVKVHGQKLQMGEAMLFTGSYNDLLDLPDLINRPYLNLVSGTSSLLNFMRPMDGGVWQGQLEYVHPLLNIYSNRVLHLTCDGTGRVGVNTAAPQRQLHVEGAALVTGNVNIGSGILELAGDPVVQYSQGLLNLNTVVTCATDKVGINNVSPLYTLDVGGSVYVNNAFKCQNTMDVSDTTLQVTGRLKVRNTTNALLNCTLDTNAVDNAVVGTFVCSQVNLLGAPFWFGEAITLNKQLAVTQQAIFASGVDVGTHLTAASLATALGQVTALSATTATLTTATVGDLTSTNATIEQATVQDLETATLQVSSLASVDHMTCAHGLTADSVTCATATASTSLSTPLVQCGSTTQLNALQLQTPHVTAQTIQVTADATVAHNLTVDNALLVTGATTLTGALAGSSATFSTQVQSDSVHASTATLTNVTSQQTSTQDMQATTLTCSDTALLNKGVQDQCTSRIYSSSITLQLPTQAITMNSDTMILNCTTSQDTLSLTQLVPYTYTYKDALQVAYDFTGYTEQAGVYSFSLKRKDGAQVAQLLPLQPYSTNTVTLTSQLVDAQKVVTAGGQIKVNGRAQLTEDSLCLNSTDNKFALDGYAGKLQFNKDTGAWIVSSTALQGTAAAAIPTPLDLLRVVPSGDTFLGAYKLFTAGKLTKQVMPDDTIFQGGDVVQNTLQITSLPAILGNLQVGNTSLGSQVATLNHVDNVSSSPFAFASYGNGNTVVNSSTGVSLAYNSTEKVLVDATAVHIKASKLNLETVALAQAGVDVLSATRELKNLISISLQGPIQQGGSVILDSSNNLTNISSITTTGNIAATGNVTATGDISATGNITATGDITSAGLNVAATQVLDSARRLKNIASLDVTGAITQGGTTVLDLTRNLTNINNILATGDISTAAALNCSTRVKVGGVTALSYDPTATAVNLAAGNIQLVGSISQSGMTLLDTAANLVNVNSLSTQVVKLPAPSLAFKQAVTGTTIAELMRDSGDLHVTGYCVTAGTVTASDQRYKQDIHTVEPEECLEKLKLLRTTQYTKSGKREYGMIAQEVKEVLPDAVSVAAFKHWDDFQYLDYMQVFALLVGAINGLQEKVKALESKN